MKSETSGKFAPEEISDVGKHRNNFKTNKLRGP
jgi:hypothetical protein